jgi:hypothetical protein
MRHDERFRAAVEDEWQRALADAGIAREQARLWLCQGFGAGGDGTAAKCYKRWLDIDDDLFLSPDQKREAESDEARPLHRVVLFEDYGDDLGDTLIPTVGGLLRHELHHAGQYEAVEPSVFDIDDLLDEAIRVKVGGLPGGPAFYNQKPVEQDANAAAAMYLRKHHPDHVDLILDGPMSHLARSLTPPESFDTLLARTVACLYQYRDVCVRWWDSMDFALRLGALDKRAERLWRELDAARQPDDA